MINISLTTEAKISHNLTTEATLAPELQTTSKINMKNDKTHYSNQQSCHVGYTSSHSNTAVKQHWACIALGWESLESISGSTVPLKGS
jgi:hypothetical protein